MGVALFVVVLEVGGNAEMRYPRPFFVYSEQIFAKDFVMQVLEDEPQETVKYWMCEECGYKDHGKPMPLNRAAFYLRVEKFGHAKCPKCKSQTFAPVGF